MRAVAIIQARMGSSRLPGKVLAPLAGAPLLARMVERVRAARRLDGIVIATTRALQDEPVRRLAAELDLGCVAGSEDDVLSRFVLAAERYGADPIVRLTADCPLIDPEVIDACVDAFGAAKADIAGLGGAFPDGLDTEVVAGWALRRADAEARLRSEREHVTPFLWNRPERFRTLSVPFPEAAGDQRWTVDEPRDLELVRAVYTRLYRPGHVFGWRAVLELMRSDPGLGRLNAGIVRNAGYRRSLADDALVEVER